MSLWLFIFGLAAGSFINVVALRYGPDKFILSPRVVGGRSYCPHCRNKLKWFELVPLLSFLFLRGRCRNCRQKISWQYPLVELISGLIFVLVPTYLSSLPVFKLANFLSLSYTLLAIGYTLVFITLLLITLIDIRLKLIPDEANIFLIILSIPIILFGQNEFGLTSGSFLGPSAAIFSLRDNIWLNHLASLVFGALFFAALIFITRGRGMGMGDLKLAAALGVVFGWPDIILITVLSFILGSIFGLPSLITKKMGLKSSLPFGPFIALGALTTFFFAEDLARLYFNLFRG